MKVPSYDEAKVDALKASDQVPHRAKELLLNIVEHERHLVLVRLKLTGSRKDVADLLPIEQHLANEARIVFSLFTAIRKLFPDDSVFIVCPHRAQRSFIKAKLAGASNVKTDTVERMQGDQAQIVIVCFGFTSQNQVKNELDFVFNKNRLNVAVSRAQKLCIVLASEFVLWPPMEVMASEGRRDALNYVKRFEGEPRTLKVDWRLQVTAQKDAIEDA